MPLKILLLVFMFAVVANAAPRPRYMISDLGSFEIWYRARPTKINEAGQIIGTLDFYWGFLWENGSTHRLPPLPKDSWTEVVSLNDRGVSVGSSAIERAASSSPVSWNGISISQITISDTNVVETIPLGINNLGWIISRSFIDNFPSIPIEALVLSKGGGLQYELFRPSDAVTWARVNNAGTVLFSAVRGGGSDYHIWTEQTGTQPFDVPGSVRDLNDLGDVVGTTYYDFDDTGYLLERDGSIEYFAPLWLHGRSYAEATNNVGDVVGMSCHSRGCSPDICTERWERRAVLWRDGEAFDLTLCIEDNPGWHLQRAVDINDKGQIVGTGYNSESKSVGYLLTPVDDADINLDGSVDLRDYAEVQRSMNGPKRQVTPE